MRRPLRNVKSKGLFFLAFFSMVFSGESFALDLPGNLDKEEKVIALNVAVASATFLWGFAYWNYGKYKPHFKAEGWFAKDTYRGGADKLGHLYASYLFATGLSHVYSSWGYDRADAARLGALSSFGLQALMEVGDSISSYGFSYEDVVANGVGSSIGYLLYRYPDISRKIDLRLEYFPSEGLIEKKKSDFTTDYDGMKFLVAIKSDGFDFIKDKYLKYTELHVGYYTRGYKWATDGKRSRTIYFAVGLNVSKIFESLSFNKTAKFFNYYQVPYTYLPISHDFK